MSILYCDCFSGISGDMFLGALLDAGLPLEHLNDQLLRLNLPEFSGATAGRVHKGAVVATLLDLHIHEELQVPEAAHAHSHGAHHSDLDPEHHLHEHDDHDHHHAHHHDHEHEHEHQHDHAGEHEHVHHHEHDHTHDADSHTHETPEGAEHSGEHQHTGEYTHSHDHAHTHGHRNLPDIQKLIESSGLPEPVQRISLDIFRKLAEAEAGVHGSTVEEVHFHEVGATDSILDIVGAAIGLHYFDIQSVYSSPVPLGSGQVITQHGLLPIPAPATLELLRAAQAQVKASPATSELVTPTGAAILATLATFSQPEMKIQRVGVGAGRKDFEWPNILRLIIGE